MSEYLFPVQRDRCKYCDGPVDTSERGRVWRRNVLPWVFCSENCCREYYDKDGAVAEASP